MDVTGCPKLFYHSTQFMLSNACSFETCAHPSLVYVLGLQQ